MITISQRTNRRARVLGVAALFSGAALLAHILSGIALPLALALTATLLVTALVTVWRRSGPAERQALLASAAVGFAAGLSATLIYDLTKWFLSYLDPTPYNPFEALPIFGALLVGRGAPPALHLAAGIAFHLTNGIAFGVAFCFLFGRRGVLAGIAWGIFLELFQLTLYPGWLNVRAYDEFARISALSHVVYGLVLGWTCRYGLQRLRGEGVRADRTGAGQPPAAT